MALSQSKKFSIIGNEISSNIMAMFMKYHLRLGNIKNKIDIYHLKPDGNQIFNTYRVPYEKLEANGKIKIDSASQKFEIIVHNRSLFNQLKNTVFKNDLNLEEFYSKYYFNTNNDKAINHEQVSDLGQNHENSLNSNKNTRGILLGESHNFYRLNKNKQINYYIFDKMKILENKNFIDYGKKANLKSYYIHKQDHLDKNNSKNDEFSMNKYLSFFLILQMKLFDYKIISRADISSKLAQSDMNLEEYLNLLKVPKTTLAYLKDFYNYNGDIDKFSNIDARFFLNNFRRGKEVYKMTKDNRVLGEFKNALHLKLNFSEAEFSDILNKATNNIGVYINNVNNSNGINNNYNIPNKASGHNHYSYTSIDPFICDNLIKNLNQNNKIFFCGNINSIQNILPDSNSIANKLKYDLNDLNILLNNKRKFYYEIVLNFRSIFDYENFQKKVNGYFYHYKDKNIFFILKNNLFKSVFDDEKNPDYNYYKIIVKADKDYEIEEILRIFNSIFKQDIEQTIVLTNKFTSVSKIPDKGYYRKYVDLFYKYFDQNIILFFSDIYKFNFNNLLIEEYLVSEAVANLLNEKK